MANKKHLAKINKSTESWNRWRVENKNVEPDLSEADLSGYDLCEIDLSGVNLSGADLSIADFNAANLSGADLSGANLCEADLRDVDLSGSFLNGTDLSGANLRWVNFKTADLSGADLSGAEFNEANLNGADLSGANLINANLTLANCSKAIITGVKTYAWNITDWKIEGIKCDYIFTDPQGKRRLPLDRDFQKGEFEKLFKQLPTIEYYFENGITPIDVVLMDQVIAEIRSRNPEFEIEMQSVERKGLYPCFKFTVKHELQKEQVISILNETKDKKYEELRIALIKSDTENKLLKEILSNFQHGLFNAVNQKRSILFTGNNPTFFEGDNITNNEYNITINHLNELSDVVDKNETLPDKVKIGIKKTIQDAIKDIGKDGIKEGLKKIGVILKPHIGILKDAIIKISPELWKYYLQ
jgi:hypothetical protein